jgi:hypothetical protein
MIARQLSLYLMLLIARNEVKYSVERDVLAETSKIARPLIRSSPANPRRQTVTISGAKSTPKMARPSVCCQRNCRGSCRSPFRRRESCRHECAALDDLRSRVPYWQVLAGRGTPTRDCSQRPAGANTFYYALDPIGLLNPHPRSCSSPYQPVLDADCAGDLTSRFVIALSTAYAVPVLADVNCPYPGSGAKIST